MQRPKAYTISFAKVYPMYIQKAERKGRTKDELAKGKAMEKILRS